MRIVYNKVNPFYHGPICVLSLIKLCATDSESNAYVKKAFLDQEYPQRITTTPETAWLKTGYLS